MTLERCNYTTTNFSQHNDKISWRSIVPLNSTVLVTHITTQPRKNFAALCDTLSNRELSCKGLFAPKEFSMQIRKLRTIVLVSASTIFLSASLVLAQDGAKQDMKAAGTETKNAAKDTGHGVATGTKKVYHKTANGTKTATDKTVEGTKTVGKDVGHGTKVAAKDTANGTKKVGDKIAGKPAPPQ
jgi:hypothetical protein